MANMAELERRKNHVKKTRAASRGKRTAVAIAGSKTAAEETQQKNQGRGSAGKTSTGGFSPRLATRPEYPSFWNVLWHTVLSYIRIPLLCTLLTLGVEPLYQTIVVDYALRTVKLSERAVFTAGTLIVHTVLYILINGFFMLCQYKGWLEEYRFERKSYQVPKEELVKRTFLEAAVGQFVTGPIVLFYLFTAFKYYGMPSLDSELPDFSTMFGYFALSHLVNDVGFYWSHRLVHHPSLYSWIHKQHHTYTGSMGIAAEYASPLEQIFSNQLPTVGGCLFFGAHPLVFWIWLSARLQQTYEGHSGYCFAGTMLHKIGMTNSEAAAYHDYHHSGNRGNFGARWLDWTFGTMDAWVDLGETEGYIKLCRSYRLKKELI